MSVSVFAGNMGFFHKGSNGTGIAPLDVCLTPPPPPAGPVPVPYVNVLQASNLTKGSKKVKIQGKPTALESKSQVSTSTGDEPGTQGGGVITAKTKGKGSFKLWSFDVKVEGKGVACHGHMMSQNTQSDPPNCIDAAALTSFKASLGDKLNEPCPPYDRDKHAPNITAEQDKAVEGKTCWECQRQKDAGEEPLTMNPDDNADFGNWLRNDAEYKSRSGGKYKDRDREAMTPDHQPPLSVAWALGGCHMEPTDGDPTGFQKQFAKPEMVKPHCRRHSNSQGPTVGAFARRVIANRG